MGELMKTERVLEGNLCNLFVVMSLCNSDVQNKVENSTYLSELEESLDSIGLFVLQRRLLTLGKPLI